MTSGWAPVHRYRLNFITLGNALSQVQRDQLAFRQSVQELCLLAVLIGNLYRAILDTHFGIHHCHKRIGASEDEGLEGNLDQAWSRKLERYQDKASRNYLAFGVVEVDLGEHRLALRVQLAAQPRQLSIPDDPGTLRHPDFDRVTAPNRTGRPPIEINKNAQTLVLRNGEHRKRAGLRICRILYQRSAIGIARGHRATKGSAEDFIGLLRFERLHRRLGHLRVGWAT